MKVSLRATYGIMAAVDLALQNGHAPIQAKSIARRQAIPARFLEQVLHAMKRAGLVTSQRGAQGGYLLSKSPGEVSLAEILEAFDGPLTPARGEHSQGDHRLRRQESLLSGVWDQVKQAELSVLGAVTLEELANRQQAIEQQKSFIYQI
jgi:Rrf2 family protein